MCALCHYQPRICSTSFYILDKWTLDLHWTACSSEGHRWWQVVRQQHSSTMNICVNMESTVTICQLYHHRINVWCQSASSAVWRKQHFLYQNWLLADNSHLTITVSEKKIMLWRSLSTGMIVVAMKMILMMRNRILSDDFILIQAKWLADGGSTRGVLWEIGATARGQEVFPQGPQHWRCGRRGTLQTGKVSIFHASLSPPPTHPFFCSLFLLCQSVHPVCWNV